MRCLKCAETNQDPLARLTWCYWSAVWHRLGFLGSDLWLLSALFLALPVTTLAPAWALNHTASVSLHLFLNYICGLLLLSINISSMADISSNSGLKRSKRSKWSIFGSVVALLGVIAIAVGVGVGVSNKTSGVSTSSGSTTSSNPGPPKLRDPNDPSTFVKNPNLKQSFYGMSYTPEGSLLPNCGNSLSAIIQDIQLMSQLTKRVRLYGADCNQSALVLEAIKQTKVDMQVFLGNYPTPDDTTTYTRQRDTIKAAIQTYGIDHIAGITVGNEYILNYLKNYGSEDPNGDVGNKGQFYFYIPHNTLSFPRRWSTVGGRH